MRTVRLYLATVTYRTQDGRTHEEEFPVCAFDHTMAGDMAFAYALQVLKLKDFELRVVGG